jgi:hypothetical protein
MVLQPRLLTVSRSIEAELPNKITHHRLCLCATSTNESLALPLKEAVAVILLASLEAHQRDTWMASILIRETPVRRADVRRS